MDLSEAEASQPHIPSSPSLRLDEPVTKEAPATDHQHRPLHWMRHLRTNRTTKAVDTTWKTTYFRWGPLLGIGALLFVILSVPAAAIVLVVSHGQAVEDWNASVAPSVYLSVLTSVGNKALAFAAGQGALTTWWLRALQGSTLRKLHDDWSSGTNAWSALTAGRKTGLLAITTLCGIIILGDGILLQSATSTTGKALNQPVSLKIRLSSEVPTSFGGLSTSSEFQNSEVLISGPTGAFKPILPDFSAHKPITSAVKGCKGTCSAIVTAPALALVRCNTVHSDFLNATEARRPGGKPLPDTDYCYEKVVATLGDTKPGCIVMELYSGLINSDSPFEEYEISVQTSDRDFATRCEGYISRKVCTYRAAVAEYDTTIQQNGTVSILDVNFGTARIISVANNTKGLQLSETSPQPQNTTLAGLGHAFSLTCGVVMGFGWHQSTEKTALIDGNAFTASIMEGEGRCGPIWKDPYPPIVTLMNEVMFHTGVQAAKVMNDSEILAAIDPNLALVQTISGVRTDTQAVFVTRWEFFWAAAALQLTCVSLVSVTFWSYWRLGRATSFSPLEIAKAFDAPALRSFPSNMDADDLAKETGVRAIRYGAIVECGGESDGDGDNPTRRLLFEDPEKVYWPMNTFLFVP